MSPSAIGLNSDLKKSMSLMTDSPFHLFWLLKLQTLLLARTRELIEGTSASGIWPYYFIFHQNDLRISCQRNKDLLTRVLKGEAVFLEMMLDLI